MGAPESEGGGGGDERSSIALMLRHPSARQCYFEMKTNKEPNFSILSSIILCQDPNIFASPVSTQNVETFFISNLFDCERKKYFVIVQ